MTRSELLQRLETLAEPQYREFSSKLLPGSEKMLGVRMPLLHKIAKEIARGDIEAFLREPCGEIFEERMVRGLVIAHGEMSLEQKLKTVQDFLPLIQSWSVCDGFCAALKDAAKEQVAFYELLRPCLCSAECYEQRFGLVMLTDWYLNDEYIDRTLEHFFSFDHPDYYARMAAAWGISIAFVKYPEKTLEFLKASRLDPFTHNTAIRKIRESRRPTAEQKAFVLKLKKVIS